MDMTEACEIRRREMSVEITIEFERECYVCYGGSRWSGKDCNRCANTGRVATELGEQLIEFLEHQQERDAAKQPTTTEP